MFGYTFWFFILWKSINLYFRASLYIQWLPYGPFIIPTGFPCSSVSKESACNAEDLGLIPGSGRSPGGWNLWHLSVGICSMSFLRRDEIFPLCIYWIFRLVTWGILDLYAEQFCVAFWTFWIFEYIRFWVLFKINKYIGWAMLWILIFLPSLPATISCSESENSCAIHSVLVL